jgi:hypothetical protein
MDLGSTIAGKDWFVQLEVTGVCDLKHVFSFMLLMDNLSVLPGPFDCQAGGDILYSGKNI